MTNDPLAVVYAAAEEVRTNPSYYYDNSRRRDANGLVIQRTVSGAGFFSDAAGRQLVPVDSAMIFTHREATSYGYPPEAREPYRLRVLVFAPTAALLALSEWLRGDFGSVVRLPTDSEVGQIFEEIYDRFKTRSFVDRFHESEMLYRLFIALYREQVRVTQVDDPIEFGHHLLRDQFRKPINLKTVAAKVGVSREHFIRKFTGRFGESPGVLLRRLRMAHARSLLAATNLTVEEVALASGFTSSTSFCRAYRRVFRGRPGAGRKAKAT
jgi:AraC-like DNA-binding protein